MTPKRMSQLFDVNLDTNLDEAEDVQSVTTFDNRVQDAKNLLSKDIEVDDTALIHSAINTHNLEPVSEPVLDKESSGDVVAEVDADIMSFDKKIQSTEHTESASESASESSENPLELDGSDLKAYIEIKSRYPQFVLYDGSVAFREFYRHKVFILRQLLGQFPLLNVSEMIGELQSIKVNHFLGDNAENATPDLIRVKLDDAYRQRARLSGLLSGAFEQFYVWDRLLDLLRSKLWKDHEVKGAHRRDGMVLEHMSDMENYVASLKGFIESAKHFDQMLRAAADNLSRQLTCIQLNDSLGLRVKPTVTQGQSVNNENTYYNSNTLKNLDTVGEGTVISAPKPKPASAVMTVRYGHEDELSQLG